MNTRQILRTLALAIASSVLSATAVAQSTMRTVRVASGLTLPLFAGAPRDDFSRLFIVQQDGLIKILNLATGTVNATPFLNVSTLLNPNGTERGLLGLAFHPSYASNRRFFVYYTRADGALTVAEYSAPSASANVANPNATRIVIAIPHGANANHNGGCLQFGPDGYLYFGTGDGGGQDDSPCNAQNGSVLLGKLIRLDVDSATPYAIPPTNPFVSDPNFRDEIWAFGLRNPWRISFDRLTGDLYVGDVGQNTIEEIDFQSASSAGGQNYAWKLMEGNNCYLTSNCVNPPPCNSTVFSDPIFTYSHAGANCSITGGYVYRGCAIPAILGTYFYADYCSNQIWSFRFANGNVSGFANRTAELAPGGGLSITSVSSFGEDAFGELYICDLSGGELFKIVPVTMTDCNSNLIADGCDIASGNSSDADFNGVPDECQGCPVIGTYCTAGTTTHGCIASISGTGTPSASSPSGFTIRATNVEGQESGLIFYGLSGSLTNPWSSLSTSYLCVHPPTQRTGLQNSGGASGVCNGAIQIDWNAYIASHPTSLGVPFSAGAQVWAQVYFRDPPAPKTTNLSNGLTFIVCP